MDGDATIRDRVREWRAADPTVPAATMARELGVTREWVRRLLLELGLATDVRDVPRVPPWVR